MKTLLLLLYPLLPAFLSMAAVCIASVCTKKERTTGVHLLRIFLFLVYLCAVFSVTGIGSVWDIAARGGLLPTLSGARVNLLPFHSEGLLGLFTYAMNVLLFLPFGFFLPFLWEGFRSVRKALLSGAGFSLFLELAQIPSGRYTDIDDLLMNTLGAFLGYLLWRTLRRKNPKHLRDTEEQPLRGEAALCLLLPCIFRFFLYNWRLFIY